MMTTKTRAQTRKEMQKKGFTLTEIAIVLGIMGLVLGAIWVAAAGVYNNQRINQGNTAVMQVLQAVRTLYGQQATMPTADQSVALINAGVIPTNLVGGTPAAPTLVTPWGGAMFVGGAGVAPNGAGVSIQLYGMTSALCVGLISQIFGASHDRTLDTASTVGNGGGGAYVVMGYNATPVSVVPTPTTNGAAPAYATPGATTNCGTGTGNGARLVFGLQG